MLLLTDGLCPNTDLRGKIAPRPVDSVLQYLPSGGVYQSTFVHNPNDVSTLNDYRFYGYVTVHTDGTPVAVLGVQPCAPLNFKLNNVYTAKWASFVFDVTPAFERFTNFSAVDVFGQLGKQEPFRIDYA